jgi:hypothetical protein
MYAAMVIENGYVYFSAWYVVWGIFFILHATLTPLYLCVLLSRKAKYVRFLEVEVESLQERLAEASQPSATQVRDTETVVRVDPVDRGKGKPAMSSPPRQGTDWQQGPPPIRR